MSKRGIAGINVLSVIAIIIAIMMGVSVFFSTQTEVAVLKNDVKALNAELDSHMMQMGAQMKRLEAPDHEITEAIPGEHTESEQLQPTVELTLQTYFTDSEFGFIGIGGNIDGVKNPTIHVHHGDIIEIVLVNGDGMPHDFIIDGLGVHSGHVNVKGEKSTTVFQVEEEGEFQYYCSVPGHRALGMEGVIEIEESH